MLTKISSHLYSALFLVVILCTSSFSQAVRTQTIDLVPGWNAVHLEVNPLNPVLNEIFFDLPVDVVTSHTKSENGAQFILNPGADMQKAYGWSVWYSPERSDSILSTLFEFVGGQCYLIHAHTNVSFSVQGEIPIGDFEWTPNAYNLVGFTVQNPGAPTFDQFFSSSSAHNHNKIYRLNGGTWRQVLDPSSQVMRSGEAFWIYTDGHSSYKGPLEVSLPSVIGVALDSQGSSDITFRNNTDNPVTFWVDHIPEENTAVPLQSVVRAFDTDLNILRDLTITYEAGPWSQDFPPLSAGEAIRFPLRLKSTDTLAGISYTLLRIQSDIGTEVYVPVTAFMEDLD